MKFCSLGRVALAAVVSMSLCAGVTSCSSDSVLGYIFATSAKYGQVYSIRVDQNTGKLREVANNGSNTQNSPSGSGGTNPTKLALTSDSQYLYVLNTVSTSAAPAPIALFTVGGSGDIFYQTSFTSQGTNPVDIKINGNFLYVLDQNQPSDGPDPTAGDITVFAINSSNGRLTLVTNTQQPNLTYFPVGHGPVQLAISSSLVYALDQGDAAIYPYAIGPNGQLTLTQSSGPSGVATGGTKPTAITLGSTYLFVADAGTDQIFTYTFAGDGTPQPGNGGVASLLGSQPTALVTASFGSGSYVYVAEAVGQSSSTATSIIEAFIVNSNGQLTPVPQSPFPASGAQPQCILITPSVPYLYTANFGDGTIAGKQIATSTGSLETIENNTLSYTTPGQAECLIFTSRH